MAMPILPAVTRAAGSIASAMPGLIDTAGKKYTTVKTKLDDFIGKDSKIVANQIKRSGNGLSAQALLMNAIRAGFPLDEVFSHVPLLTEDDKAILASHYTKYVQDVRQTVDAQQTPVPNADGELVAPSAPVVRNIQLLCRELNVSSDILADVIVALETLKTSDIKQYQAYFDSVGARRL